MTIMPSVSQNKLEDDFLISNSLLRKYTWLGHMGKYKRCQCY
jgi:hypothetical protein